MKKKKGADAIAPLALLLCAWRAGSFWAAATARGGAQRDKARNEKEERRAATSRSTAFLLARFMSLYTRASRFASTSPRACVCVCRVAGWSCYSMRSKDRSKSCIGG